MTPLNPSYADLPLPPQVVRNAPLLTIFLEVDPAIVSGLLPRSLALRPDSRLVLNMWSHSDPNENSGFGSFGKMSVSYLAVEVAGEEGSSADGSTRFPGRYWLYHWSDFGSVRDYARAASGLEIMPGETFVRIDSARLSAGLSIDGTPAITASARVGREKQRTISGRSVYYAQRARSGGGVEVARFEIPWVSDAFDASAAEVEFSFPRNTPPAALFGNHGPLVVGVNFRSITLVPYLAQRAIAV